MNFDFGEVLTRAWKITWPVVRAEVEAAGGMGAGAEITTRIGTAAPPLLTLSGNIPSSRLAPG
jgi:hypothetical protein